MKRRQLVLRRVSRAEHLAGGSLIEADLGIGETGGLEKARDSQGRELAGKVRLLPRSRHERLGGQIIDFVRFGPFDGGGE